MLMPGGKGNGAMKVQQMLVLSKVRSWTKQTGLHVLREYGIFVIFIALCLAIGLMRPVFFSLTNIFNVIRQVSMIGIIGAGMTFVILAADIDLSVGSVAAFCGALCAGLMVWNHFPVLVAILIALLVAGFMGWVIGIITTKANVHSFVVTLGMMSVARGATLVYTRGLPISGTPRAFAILGEGMVGPVPVPVILFICGILIGHFVLTRTVFGRAVYAVGGNREAARLSGIKVDRIRITNFVICSTLAGLAGIILTSRVRSAVPLAAQGWELDVIASVIIGGTSLFGGRGGVIGTLIGALFLGVLRNGADLLGVSPYYQQVLMGAVVIGAVVLDRVRHRAVSTSSR
jgi:ribose/xylose/arabinose/galactoside ABC-type transport system permease subunit